MSNRPAIVSISGSSEMGDTRIEVTLGFEDQEYSGTAVGATTESSRARLVGEATLRAIEEIAGEQVSLNLVAIARTDFEDVHIAMAQIAMSGIDDPLVGSVLVRDEDDDATTVRAVLDAINRAIGGVL